MAAPIPKISANHKLFSPGEWEPHYIVVPVMSINNQLLYHTDAYRRYRHKYTPSLGYEYATILDIVGM